MRKDGFVYILTNKVHTVLYIGVTSNLERRLFEHRTSVYRGFSWKYRAHKLVYYEQFDSILEAIGREKSLKGKTRAKKEAPICGLNPVGWSWGDLSASPQDDECLPTR